MSVKTKRLLLLVLLIAFIGISGTVPLQQSIDCVCAVEPADVWYFMRDGAQISTGWEKKLLDSNSPRTLRQFESTDIVEVELVVSNGSAVSIGDTVATIKSQEQIGQLLELQAELREAVAQRAALIAGERIEDQMVAKQRLNRAQATLEAYQSEYDQVKELYEKDFAPLSDWQREQRRYRLYEADIEVAQARYDASLVGARSEDVSVIDAEINRLQQLIDNANSSQMRMETITTPLGGIVRLGDLEGVIMRIERNDTMAVTIIVPEVVAGNYPLEQSVNILLSAQPDSIRFGKIKQINYIATDQINAYGTLFLENSDNKLHSGMNGIATLPLGEMTLWQSIRIKLQGLQQL